MIHPALIIFSILSFITGAGTTFTVIEERKLELGSLIAMILGFVGIIPALIMAGIIYCVRKLNKKVLWRW